MTEIPNVLWYAGLMGAIINVLLLCMLKIRPRTQFLVGAITSFFLGVILFVIVTLDDPLRGKSGLNPTPLDVLWEREVQWDEGVSWGRFPRNDTRTGTMAEFVTREVEGMRQVVMTLDDETVRAARGALSNMRGKIDFTPRLPAWATCFGRSFPGRGVSAP